MYLNTSKLFAELIVLYLFVIVFRSHRLEREEGSKWSGLTAEEPAEPQ